ncbi:MAG: hypothetical protein ABJG41_03425 [Cyclobacteriaceae bacterium]
MRKRLSYITVLLVIVSGCKQDKLLENEGVSFVRLAQETNEYHIGDSLVFTFGYVGSSRLKYIDVSLTFGNSSDPILYESFYPGTNNALEQVRWKLTQDLGLQVGYYYYIEFHSVSQNRNGTEPFRQIKIIE